MRYILAFILGGCLAFEVFAHHGIEEHPCAVEGACLVGLSWTDCDEHPPYKWIQCNPRSTLKCKVLNYQPCRYYRDFMLFDNYEDCFAVVGAFWRADNNDSARCWLEHGETTVPGCGL